MTIRYRTIDEMLEDAPYHEASEPVHEGQGAIRFTDYARGIGFPRYYSVEFKPADVGGRAYSGPLTITNNWWDF
ncbi:hypothetical protein [Sorangium sp. So ce381]|uniref:hypothetical protein n=1 Tax=Sorangium sp. So ce381 TaxID=3133307 RepID=UPI003F5B8F0B